jgi:hypothetical protein
MASGPFGRDGGKGDTGGVELDLAAHDDVASRKILGGLISGEGGNNASAGEMDAAGTDADAVDGFLAGLSILGHLGGLGGRRGLGHGVGESASILFKLLDFSDGVLGGAVKTALLDDQIAEKRALFCIFLPDFFNGAHRKASYGL